MPIQIDLGSSNPTPQTKAAPRGPVVGIDLGTTNSLVAYAANGKSTILKAADEEAMLPSVVAYSEGGKVENVGIKAREDKVSHSERVLYSVKRLMGKSLKDLGAEVDQIPYYLQNDDLNSQVQIKIGTKLISPIEVSAEILKALKLRAEKSLGQPVERAVITVPAYFDDAQRTATKAAGRLAGLEVIRVFNEPTAAALAYGWSHEHPGVVAVYDLGGGTFDFSIVRIQENIYEVLATAGDTHLGGDDFDQALALYLFESLKTQGLAEKWPAMAAQLLSDAESLKRKLSDSEQTTYTYKNFNFELTRPTVEGLWNSLVDRTLSACEQALSDAKLKKQDLADVLLVGGSTRVPLVRKKVEEFFGKKTNSQLNPDEAVALGAAFQAKILEEGASDKLLLDVIPLSLGIETVGGATSKLILRNSTIPTEAREVYTNHVDNQTAFEIHILQGERELVKDCRSLAHFKLRGLSPAPAGYHRIEILFRIDANGILNVRARDLRSGKSHEIEVKASFGISEEELLKLLEDSIDQAEPDMEKRQLVDLRVEADSVIAATEKTLKNSGHLVDSASLSEIKARLIDLKNAAKSSSIPQIHEAIQSLDSVSRELAELQMNAAMNQAFKGKEV